MTKIEQIEHFQTRVHRFSLLMPIGDSHHHTLYIMYASRFKSPNKETIVAQLTPLYFSFCRTGDSAQLSAGHSNSDAWMAFCSLAQNVLFTGMKGNLLSVFLLAADRFICVQVKNTNAHWVISCQVNVYTRTQCHETQRRPEPGDTVSGHFTRKAQVSPSFGSDVN